MATGLPYNGWSALIRHGRDKHYYHAQKKKLLPQKPICIVCGANLPSECIPYHAEEYGPTLEEYWMSCVPMCHRCHAMLHARFITPNRWRLFLHQAVSGGIDNVEFPMSKSIAPMLSRFKSKEDIEFVPMPDSAPPYVVNLPEEEYTGPPKAATLRVMDQATGNEIEVPDWTLYGEGLEQLNGEERQRMIDRGIDIEGFLGNRISILRNKAGKRVYKRLYA